MYNSFLGGISQIKNSITRSISPENFTGEKGNGAKAEIGTGSEASRDLGKGWKVSPSIIIKPGETRSIAKINGEGIINHIWATCFPKYWRDLIIKIYWDNSETPAINVPFGDFFCNGWCERVNINSIPIAVNPAGGMNSYFEMPFKKAVNIVVESRATEEFPLYYQIDYAFMDLPENMGYLHAYWNRSNPLKYKENHVILPKIKGKGHYVGTYIAWQVNNSGWWGEGEIKFFLDGDDKYPTICGTGTEDYFGGAWNFEQPKGEYHSYSTAFLGLPQVIKPDGLYRSQQRFGMYRWHIMDPITFKDDLKVTIQALGWRQENRYLPLQDDIASVAYWYQDTPENYLKELPDRDILEVV